MTVYFILLIIILGLMAGGVYILWHRQRFDSLNLKILLVKIARREAKDQKDFLFDINLLEQFLSALTAIKEPFVLETAVHSSGGDIYFYVGAPRNQLEFVARQIQGFFPDSQVDEVADYTIFANEHGVRAGYLALEEAPFVPIRTYREAEVDSFAPIVSTLSRLREEGDGAALQLVISPAGTSFKKTALDIVAKLRKGEKLKKILKSYKTFAPVSEIAGELFSSSKKDDDKKLDSAPIDNEVIESIEAKIRKPLFNVNVRVVAAGDTDNEAGDIMLAIGGAFSQFSSPRRNGFKLVLPKGKKIKKLVHQYIFRESEPKEFIVLNTEEIASIFHFPTVTTDIPRIKWLKSREAPPPQNLPPAGVVVGESLFRGDMKPVRMADNDRRRHFYCIGQTGTGKSYFMLNTIAQDMEAGKGLCVIDPHGELVDKVLERVPASRLEDVIVFNPGDVGRPLGLNMLEYNFDRPEEKTFIVNEIQSIFNRLFDKETMGPMFEQYMRNSLLLLMEDAKYEPATLMEVPRIFTDPAFRNKKLGRISNPTVIDFWEKEASKTTGEQGLANMTPYITSKFGNFIANDYMRPIIGQPKSAFNFREVMDGRKILLVNLAKGKIGDINAGLLGMICTGRLLLAALSRTDIPENDRKDFYLYIDEFQNFTTDSISVILSEARKYRLNLILAHQFIAQLTDEIREAVFGNVGSLAAFRVGTTDAEHLVKHFGQTFTENDLISIENQNAYLKILINGEPAKPFNIKVPRVDGGSRELAEQLKELSRLTYGRDLGQVEQEILFRLRQ
ncbi:MAG: hypothetical protein A2571_00650 [Candidatus Vogelbacteria bacterium RIFOXYD1_FULL_44_32]|uniref:Type IV secretion system coupling protein TraD DNA-binding domain-containing protein n=1 Tax=Candidatus Vogelbacteria bacterium RIFOXYD1_FULL_44_32 TaxID=1802438 RepID=A0A1G2QEH4_9BACT|nr:MAG: hypothetical protein A2571_00650 [Candidatus Vogelbacteria bacterium RIFOXYD1_FULL_44_32]